MNPSVYAQTCSSLSSARYLSNTALSVGRAECLENSRCRVSASSEVRLPRMKHTRTTISYRKMKIQHTTETLAT